MSLSYLQILDAGGLGAVSARRSLVVELQKELYQKNMWFTSETARYKDSFGEPRPRTIRIQRSCTQSDRRSPYGNRLVLDYPIPRAT